MSASKRQKPDGGVEVIWVIDPETLKNVYDRLAHDSGDEFAQLAQRAVDSGVEFAQCASDGGDGDGDEFAQPVDDSSDGFAQLAQRAVDGGVELAQPAAELRGCAKRGKRAAERGPYRPGYVRVTWPPREAPIARESVSARRPRRRAAKAEAAAEAVADQLDRRRAAKSRYIEAVIAVQELTADIRELREDSAAAERCDAERCAQIAAANDAMREYRALGAAVRAANRRRAEAAGRAK
jgi:hypothetical protein